MDLNIITGHGLPLLIATALYATIRLIRLPFVQSFFGMISPKLQWDAWPKPLCTLIVFLLAVLGALIPALQQGTEWTQAVILSVTAGFGAMGIDAAHGAIKDPASNTAAYEAAGRAIASGQIPSMATPQNPLAPSIKVPLP